MFSVQCSTVARLGSRILPTWLEWDLSKLHSDCKSTGSVPTESVAKIATDCGVKLLRSISIRSDAVQVACMFVRRELDKTEKKNISSQKPRTVPFGASLHPASLAENRTNGQRMSRAHFKPPATKSTKSTGHSTVATNILRMTTVL